MEKLLIVGGSSGFGLALSKAFSTSYTVTTTGRREFALPNIKCLKLDSSYFDLKWLRSIAPQIVVNNGYDKCNHIASFENSISVVRESVKYFKEIGGGTIVNVNSIYGLQPDTKDPDYAASKHGLKGYIDSINYDSYLHNIRIINLYPRAIATGMNVGRSDFSDLIDPGELAHFCTALLATKSFYVSTIVFDRVLTSHSP